MDHSTKIACSALAAALVVAFALLAARAEAQATRASVGTAEAPAAAAPAAPAPQPAPPAPAPATPDASAAPAPAASAPPPVAALPPPPPGYAYVPVAQGTSAAPPASRAELTSELDEVDLRIRDLKQARARKSIAGPIVMMASGFGVALVSGVAAIASFAAAEDVEGRRLEGDRERDDDRDQFLDVNDDGRIDGEDEDEFRRIARFTSVLSVVSAGVGIAGTAWFADRMRDRNQYEPELDGLKQKHRQLRRQLDYGANFAPQGVALSVRGRF